MGFRRRFVLMIGSQHTFTTRHLVVTTSIAAMIMLVWLLAARVSGPTDLWDQTQPKTVSYTTDIIANSRWILPIERGQYHATKPPLYNWLASPVVALLGYNSEIAHKFPSIIAISICWLVLVRLGRRVFPEGENTTGVLLGWLAAMMFVSNYAMFKLGYLARPDMLLVMWNLLGWLAATTIFVDQNWTNKSLAHRITLAGVFWFCLAMAGLTKGPAALVLLGYAGLAPRIITGRWLAVNRLQWWWGVPAALGIISAWFGAAWLIDAEHVRQQFWYAEFLGRVTGNGPEGSGNGPIDILRTCLFPTFYFLSRFAPWSVLTVLAVICLLRRHQKTQRRFWRDLPQITRSWLAAAMLFIVITIGLFTLSASKKPDYIALAVPMGALLGAWWLVQLPQRVVARATWTTVAIAVTTMATMTVVNVRQPSAPSADFARNISAFIDETEQHLHDQPAPVVFCWTGPTHLQAMLGYSVVDGTAAFERQYALGIPFWVIAGCRKNSPPMFDDWVAQSVRFNAEVETVVSSDGLIRAFGWPQQMALYRVLPVPELQQSTNLRD